MGEEKGLIKLALVQARARGDARYYTTVASLAGPFFICTHTGMGRDITVGGWAMAVLLKRGGRGRQRKEVKKEEGRRPTRTIEKVGRKGVVRPPPPHLPRILVALAFSTVCLSRSVLSLLAFSCSPWSSGGKAKVVGEETREDTRGKQARLARRTE